MYANIGDEILTNHLCANVEGGEKDSCQVRTLTKRVTTGNSDELTG